MDNKFSISNGKVVCKFNNKIYNLIKEILEVGEIHLYDINNIHFSINKYTDFKSCKAFIPIGLFSNDDFKYLPFTIKLNTKRKINKDISFGFTLREDQANAVKLIKKRVRLLKEKGCPVYINLSFDCAFGKTVIGTYLITRYKLKTLIIVPRKTLITQWKDHLNNSGANVETSYHGVARLLSTTKMENIDILIVPDKHLSNKVFTDIISNNFSMVIIDESHFYNMQNDIAISRFLTNYMFKMCFGLTGSPRKENKFYIGQDIAFKASKIKNLALETISYSIDQGVISISIKEDFNRFTKIDVQGNDKVLSIRLTNNNEVMRIEFSISDEYNIKDLIYNSSFIYIGNFDIVLDNDPNPKLSKIYLESEDLTKIINVVGNRCFDYSYFFSDTISKDATREMYDLYRQFLNIESKLQKKRTKELYFIKKTIVNKLLVHDYKRHDMILAHIKKIFNNTTRCLILTEFRESMKKFYSDLKSLFDNVFIGDVQNNILKVYDNLKKINHEPYIVVSTISASFQGVSIDNLNTLIIITPISCEKTIIQACGRILRDNDIMTREIFIYNDCSISEDLKSYLVNKNRQFSLICQKHGWSENIFNF